MRRRTPNQDDGVATTGSELVPPNRHESVKYWEFDWDKRFQLTRPIISDWGAEMRLICKFTAGPSGADAAPNLPYSSTWIESHMKTLVHWQLDMHHAGILAIRQLIATSAEYGTKNIPCLVHRTRRDGCPNL